MDARVLVYAKPSAQDVFPYTIYVVAPEISSKQIKTVILTGKSFYNIRSLYLSGSDPSIFSTLNYTYFDPFSGVEHLAEKNPPFYGCVIPTFTLISEHIIEFDILDNVFYDIQNRNYSYNSLLDIIIENEAGYGLLTRDSIMYRISSWRGFIQEQKPCISGILISNSL